MENDLYKIFENSAFNHKYFLKTFKGAGAFGAVFLADELVGDTKIQEVAIKAIRKDKMSSDNIAKELITAIRLKHPNLINCITSEQGQLKHLMFDYACFGLVMEIASGTLEQYLKTSIPLQTKVLGVSEVTAIVRSVASGLAYLHEQSITHRDLKPANVLWVRDTWKISDFGIARQMGSESGTLTTSLTGTPIYMPPEVYEAKNAQATVKVAPAWDMWSLGVMIVQMLTGELPFDGLADIVQMKIQVKANLPAPFDEIVQNCLSLDPKQRWTAKQVLEKINEVRLETVNVLHNLEALKETLKDSQQESKVSSVSIDFDSAISCCKQGVIKAQSRDYKGAIADFNEAIRLNPDYYLAYYERGVQKLNLGDNQGASLDFDEVIRINPTYFNAYITRASAKAGLYDLQGWIDDYNEALRINPDCADAYAGRGDTKVYLKDYHGAVDDCNQAIHIEPNHAKAYGNRGFAKYHLGDKKGAIADLDESVRLDPNNPKSYSSRGDLKHKLGDKQGAISDLDEAIRLDPNDPLYYNSRATIKYDSGFGDNQGAIEDCNIALRINPNYPWAYYNRAAAKSVLGDKQGAIADFSESIRLSPNYAIAYSSRGNAKYQLGNSQGAIDDCNEAIRIDPELYYAYSIRANAKNTLGDKQGAIADYSEAIRLNPEFYGYSNRGAVKYQAGDYQGAINDCSESLNYIENISKDVYDFAYFVRGNAKGSLGDIQGSISDYTEAISLNPNNFGAYGNRGNQKSALGDYQGAINDHTEAIRINPENPNAYCCLGMLYAERDNREEALKNYQVAAILYQQQGNTEWYGNVRGYIRALGGQI